MRLSHMLWAGPVGAVLLGPALVFLLRVPEAAGRVRRELGPQQLLGVGDALLEPHDGWIQLNGQLFTQPRLSQMAGKGLFYLGEDKNLVPGITLQEHFDAIQYRFGAGDTEHAIASLQLSDLLRRAPRTYSGGERRRAVLDALPFADVQDFEDAGRGYRRLVPSPRPVRIVEAEAIRALLLAGFAIFALLFRLVGWPAMRSMRTPSSFSMVTSESATSRNPF